MKNKLFATAVATPAILFTSLLVTQTSMADTINVSDNGGLQLSITANRRAQAIDKTLASVTVITRKDIDKIQAQDVVDVLRLQRGIDISRNGGVASTTSVFMRGSGSEQVLVLLDGVRVSSNSGAFDWSQVSLEAIERIEIVRGPRAALYGSDSIGGVIELTTRKNAKPYVSATVGSFGTQKLSAGLSGGTEKIQASVNVSTDKSDGFSSTNIKSADYDPDDDAYQKNSVSLSLSNKFTENTKAGIELFHSNNKAKYDEGNFANDITKNDASLENISTFIESKVSDSWSQKLRLSHSNDELDIVSIFGVFNYVSKGKELNWQNDLQLSETTSAIFGLNYRDKSGKTSNFNERIKNKAIYANINNKQGKLNVDLSARFDDNSQAGNKATGQFAIGYDVSNSTSVYGSYGTAFKAPTMNELFFPSFFGSSAGNPNLQPETSKTLEVGLKKQPFKNAHFEVSAFRTEVDDQISPNTASNMVINVDKATIKGLEIGFSGSYKVLDWGVDLTHLNTESTPSGERNLRMPNNKLALNIGYTINDKTRLGIDALLVSSRSDIAVAPVTYVRSRVDLDGYGLLNLSLNHKLNKRMKVGLRLENVTDEDYELAHGYNTPKRSGYLTFSYK